MRCDLCGTRETYIREALELFVKDPPDTDYQRGYLDALKMLAVEMAGFKWNDPTIAAFGPEIKCNLPFSSGRLPICACDTKDEPPTKLEQMKCKMRGGPCSPCYFDRHPQEASERS